MAQYCINGKRIVKLQIPHTYDINKIQLGIPVMDNEAEIVGLKEDGDIVLPSGTFGPQSRKNAYGYSYADKTKSKERRYVFTNWVYPFGNTNASMVAADIYKECYPKIEVEAYGIELQLYEDESKQQFVIVNMTDDVRKKYMKEAINLMLEIYGKCYVYDDVIRIEKTIKRKRCNWEMLPPGEMPSRHVEKQLKSMNQKTDTYDIARLNYMEMYNATTMVEGVNGFKGYYAYLYDNYCVLESAFYGNATYIIPKDNWEELSQKTKRELFDEKKVVEKIDHTEKWKHNIARIFKKLGITKNV
ncbi:MAG: hypothetical protein V8S18_01960 [Lachnospira sp.]|mgnify:FL=1|jgi:hypothetical protein|nr:hypothetical protein [Lachnospira sp.]